MKVSELKHQPLKEGFIDDLVAKAKNMAGGDGLTGIIRTLSGQGAALNKLADQIARELETPLLRELGNSIGAIRNGTSDVPMGRIIQLGLRSGATVAQHDGDVVSPAEMLNFLKANKDNVVKVAGGGTAPQVIDAIVKLADTKTAEAVPNLNFDRTIKEVALVLAATIILLQAAKAEAEPAKPADRNDPNIQKFKQLGEKVQEVLFDPTSTLLRALQPNESFKDNLHWLVITLTKKVQQEIGTLPAEKLISMAGNPPPLLTPMQYKAALSGHNEAVDPETVNKIVSAVTPLVQEQFKTWLAVAAEEAKAGNGIEESLMDYGDWARESMEMIDRLQFAQPQKKTKPEPKPEEPVIKIGGEVVPKTDPAYPELLAAYKKAHPEA